MGWFGPRPMELAYGEPVHQMVVRAMRSGAIRAYGDLFPMIKYRFVGAHGYSDCGEVSSLSAELDRDIAHTCECAQRRYNERIAAGNYAVRRVIEADAVAPVFKPLSRPASSAS